MSTPPDPQPVEHVLLPTERGGIHNVQLTAGVEHRFTIHDDEWHDDIPVELLSIDGGAAIYFRFGLDHGPATIGGRDCRMMPPAVSSVTMTYAQWTPVVVRVIADGPVLISVQRADG